MKSGLQLVLQEPGTITWYALQSGPSTFGIFDTFEEEQGRNAHLCGLIAKALMEKAAELLAMDPVIENAEIIAVK